MSTVLQAPKSGNAPSTSKAADGTIFTVDDFIRQLATDQEQVPLLAYPVIEQGVSKCERFTGQDLDRFADGAAKYFITSGLGPVYEHTVVAVLAHSDLDYMVSLLGLGRLGYTALLLSPRLAAEACTMLLEQMSFGTLVYSPRSLTLFSQIERNNSIKSATLPTRQDYDIPIAGPPFVRHVDGTQENPREVFILHSSGSTGTPKLLSFTHHRVISSFSSPIGGMTALSTLPCYHTHGLLAPFLNWSKRKAVFLWDGKLPQTQDTVVRALQSSQPEALYTVPYILKLLAETQKGLDMLRLCKIVSYSGSSCPDELGNMLVSQGVHLGSLFGSTETGMIMSSFSRPSGDLAWNYLRISPSILPYIYMKPLEANIYECVVLDGHVGKIASNSDEPPKSFHSKDLFELHPTIPNAWKYIGRLDDRITLINGEKVLPLQIEGRIRQNTLVKEAVVFGVQKPMPGLLVFRTEAAADLSDQVFINAIWPTVKDANSRAEGFSQITKEMIVPISADIDPPLTDKASVKRAQVYVKFSSKVNQAYGNLHNSEGGRLKLNISELENFIVNIVKEKLDVHLPSTETSFYNVGIDSLKAIQLKGLLQKHLDLGDAGLQPDPMVVFSCGNTAQLARFLFAVRTGASFQQGNKLEEMEKLINRYSVFDRHVPGTVPQSENYSVILTGATGGLGAHLLTQLIERDSICKIYCLVRAESFRTCSDRLLNALALQGLEVSNVFGSKTVPLACDFRKKDLGLSIDMMDEIRNHVSLVIHAAWDVNFTLGLRDFEEYHLKGLQNLLNLTLSVKTPRPARFIFCSSVSVAVATPKPAIVVEKTLENLAHAPNIGYAQSKLIGEHIVCNAAITAGALSRTVRLGQIVGDGKVGLWNDDEATPLMIRSALHLKALPAFGESCSWIPVDTAAATILDLCGISEPNIPTRREPYPYLVYNIVNPHTFSWTGGLLPALQAAGLDFETVSFTDWLARLKASDQDPERNPVVKLTSFWEKLQEEDRVQGDLTFESRTTEEDSIALREAPHILENGYIEKFLQNWLERWA